MQVANPNPNQDLLLSQPTDTVSGLAWSPVPQGGGNAPIIHHLAASTWDGNLLFYQVGLDGQFQPAQTAAHKAPVLDVAWALDGSKVFTASCDKTVMSWDFGGNQGVQVAAHDDCVKFVKHVNTANGQYLVTGGWDNALKWWDGRAQQPVEVVDMKGPAHTASFNEQLGVVCTGNRRILIFDLRKGLTPVLDIESPLKYATRSVSVFGNPEGFALGSIEGRIQLHYINLDAATPAAMQVTTKCFSYKYHRDPPSTASLPTIVHSVNSITAFKDDIFVTGGSEGQIAWWNKTSRTKLAEFARHPSPITAMAFSPDLNLFAYAAGYDWHKGIEYNNQKTYPNALIVHAVTENDLKEKNPATAKTTGTLRR
jgi:mRNA export factor